MQHFSYKTGKKRLKTRDGSTDQKRKKTLVERDLKGMKDCILPHCKATDKATPTAATKTHIMNWG
jgi:hypothetical protein